MSRCQLSVLVSDGEGYEVIADVVDESCWWLEWLDSPCWHCVHVSRWPRCWYWVGLNNTSDLTFVSSMVYTHLLGRPFIGEQWCQYFISIFVIFLDGCQQLVNQRNGVWTAEMKSGQHWTDGCEASRDGGWSWAWWNWYGCWWCLMWWWWGMSVAVMARSTSPWAWLHIWLVVRVVRIIPAFSLMALHSCRCRHTSSNCLWCHASAVLIPNDCWLGDGNFKDSWGRFNCWLGWRMQDKLPEGIGDCSRLNRVRVGNIDRLWWCLSNRSSRRDVCEVWAAIRAHWRYVGCKVRSGGQSWSGRRTIMHIGALHCP